LQEEAAVVMEHSDNLYNSLFRYFNALEHMGYYDKKETMNLIIYLFIVNEIFEGRLSKHLDDEGLSAFNKAFNCLYNGCLIDRVRDNSVFKEESKYPNISRIRYSETMDPRITEDENARIPESDT
jgi:hypothetical protein